MLRLYLAAVSAVVVANVVVALATTTRHGPSRFWWLGPKVLAQRQSSGGFREFYFYMRRTVSFLFAVTLLFAGFAFSVIGIVHAQGFMPFVFFNGLILIAAGGVWLLGKFVLPK
jgi:hypothetical protein